MGVRDNAKGTVITQIMDLPAHIFANAVQLVAATIRTITGMIKTRTRRRWRTLTYSISSAKSIVNQYMPVLITIGIFVDFFDSRCFKLYRN